MTTDSISLSALYSFQGTYILKHVHSEKIQSEKQTEKQKQK